MLLFLILVCALLLMVGFLLLPGESSAEQREPFWGVNHAHRGLHTRDKSIPENSLAAFTAAVDAGYGIELDLQLTKDGEVVVFHDDNLERVCGVPGKLRDKTWAELSELRLCGTGQKIPTLRQVLELVDERVPLIIELKSAGADNAKLCRAAWRLLRQYDGDICVESFDPRIVRWFQRQVPGVLRGQLSAQPYSLGANLYAFVVGWGLASFWGRPQFLAYEKGPRPFTVRLAMRLCMSVVWTVHPEDDIADLEMENDAVIFEFYEPDPRYIDAPGEPEISPAEDEYRF